MRFAVALPSIGADTPALRMEVYTLLARRGWNKNLAAVDFAVRFAADAATPEARMRRVQVLSGLIPYYGPITFEEVMQKAYAMADYVEGG